MSIKLYNDQGHCILVEDHMVDAFPDYGVSYVAPPPLPKEEAAAQARAYRNALLDKTDWMVAADRNPSAELLAWRQALRDITTHPNFPDEISPVPEMPES